MREQRALYFALGVLSVVTVGAVTNQVSLAPSRLSLDQNGITFPDGSVQTSAFPGRKSFYVTIEQHQGNTAKTACSAGYHTASVWEILDPTQLDYAASLGATSGDSGNGPPSNIAGWVRTGYAPESYQPNLGTEGDAGFRNCHAWTSKLPYHDGTVVQLNPCWQEASDCPTFGTELHSWIASDSACDGLRSVWCVSD